MDPTAHVSPLSPSRAKKVAADPSPNSLNPQPLPRWIRHSREEGSAAFAAGAALLALDQLLRPEPAWLGTLRMRQALTAAARTTRLLRLREDLAELRDAHHLTRPADDPGPAGRLHRAWRSLASRPARLDAPGLARLAGLVAPGLSANELAAIVGDQAGRDPIFAAGAAARVQATVIGPDGVLLSLMLADLVLAARLSWSTPIPLLVITLAPTALRAPPDRRHAPGSDPDWIAVCQHAYATAAAEAYAQGLELARRAEALAKAVQMLRTKGAARGLAAVLADDVVAAANLTDLGSDRAARRFLERLVALGSLREHTGRAAFRLYGL